jgi:hypothetical protein
VSTKEVVIVENNNDFWTKIRQESEPIITHVFVVVLLSFTIVIMGGLVRLLEYLFPKQEFYFSFFEKADIWFATALLIMFGFYTLLQVGTRLIKGLREEWGWVAASKAIVKPTGSSALSTLSETLELPKQ